MIIKILKKIFGSEKKTNSPKEKVPAPSEPPKKKKSGGYRAEVKKKYGFDLPSSNTDKYYLGEKFEKESDLERACVCYEACIKNRFDGNAPYDRLIIIYRKLKQPEDVLRVVKKAITIFEKATKQGRVDGPKKLEKYKKQLEKLTNK